MPGSLRELSLTLTQLQRPKRAIRVARKSCQIAEQQGARYELAQSRVVVAELSKKRNLPDAEQLIAEAKEGMVEFEKMIEANAAMWERSDLSEFDLGDDASTDIN